VFGPQRPRLESTDIRHATGPGPDSLHGPASMRLARAEIVEAGLPDHASHLKYAGMWHTHPSAPLTPSTDDLNAWARLMERQGWTRHVALIVGAGSGGFGWEYPDYTAWVTRPDYDPATGKRIGTVCEPARVELNPL
jgi:JAB domain-containing protein similar to deubiquitination enzymes